MNPVDGMDGPAARTPPMGEQQKQKRTYSYVLKLTNLEERRYADDRHLTNAADQNIIHSRPAEARRRWPASNRNAGRLQIGTGGRLRIGLHGRHRRNSQPFRPSPDPAGAAEQMPKLGREDVVAAG
jgi:hypothetical protein